MKKRQFLFSAASMLAVPGLHAQSTRVRRVAIAMPVARDVPNEGIIAFRQRLTELGWTEGRNIEYLHGYANGDALRYEPVIVELLAQKPDVLFAYFHPMALIAKKLTQQVPIVFAISSNPEESGLVASLAKPGGNVTGASTRAFELDGKRLALVREIKPGIQRVAVVVNPAVPEVANRFSEAYGKIARTLGVQIQTVEVRSEDEIGPAFDRMARDGVQGILGTADSTHLLKMRVALASNAARVAIPAMYVDDRYVEAGGRGWLRSERTTSTSCAVARSTWTRFCAAQGPQTFRSKSRRTSAWRSTSKRPRHSGSRFPSQSSFAPICWLTRASRSRYLRVRT